MWAGFRRCVWELDKSPSPPVRKKNGDMGEVVRLSVHGDDGYPRLLRFLG